MPAVTKMLRREDQEWQAHDTDANKCQVCAENFTGTRRRHHCRTCGKVVCDLCSKNKAMYKNPADLTGPLVEGRVCDMCVPCSYAPNTVLKEAPTLKETSAYKSTYEEKEDHSATVSIRTVAKIRYAEKGFASEADTPAMTLPALIAMAAKANGDKPAFRWEKLAPLAKGEKPPESAPLDQWETMTWSQAATAVDNTAKAFTKLGMKPFDTVAIFGFNSPEWVLAELGAITGGGIATGIYPTDTPAQVFYKARHSGSVISCCEDRKKADMFIARAAELPQLKAVVVWSGEAFPTEEQSGVTVCHWSELEKLAKDVDDAALEERVKAQQPGNCCALIYTSGTTGFPKAVMITHDNVLFECRGVVIMVPAVGAQKMEERVMSYLPLSHVAGMLVDIITPICVTVFTEAWCCVYFARVYDLKTGTLGDRLRAVRPTMFIGVPRVWEKVADALRAKVAENPLTGLKKRMAQWAKRKGLEHQNNMQMGGSGEKPTGYGIAKSLILDLVRQRMGLDACKFSFSGAAPISVEVLEYFGSLGIQINEIYGMSECTGTATFSDEQAHVWGSCGWANYGTEVGVFTDTMEPVADVKDWNKPTEKEQGEICYRGRHIMLGYLANPDMGEEHVAEITKKTNEAITSQGWLRSGDKGFRDTRGMFKITGRFKELIIGAGGENIAPVPVEESVKKLHAGVSNVMMVGDQQKFNVALITLMAVGATGATPGGDELAGGALAIDKKITTITGACANAAWVKTITDAIIATNKNEDAVPSNAAKIQRFTILPADFSVDTEELTPTYKLKRSAVAAKYSMAIEALYAYDGKESYVPFVAPTDA